MAGLVGQAFVDVIPVTRNFRAQVASSVTAAIPRGGVEIAVAPSIARGSTVTWETIGGAAIASSVPLPVKPEISPAAAAGFRQQVGGLRGLLLGAGQTLGARALGISALAGGVFLFGKAALGAIKGAADLEQELNVFQQVSGATADQMARVSEEARRLGADVTLPAVSAGDAAQAMTELAKAGLSVDDVLKGTRGTLQLAAAAQLDFASASEISANALNAFDLPGTQAVRVADLLAGAANAAQGDIASFGLAMSQTAAVAHQAGLSIEDTSVFLTLLAKAGIQGSDAGTSLKTALLRLIAPVGTAGKLLKTLGIETTDAQGAIRPDVFEQLRVSLDRLSPALRNQALALIFGTDAIRAAAVFTRQGAAGFQETATQVERTGQASEAAAARMSGLKGEVSALSSNVQTLGTNVGTLAIPALTAFVGVLNATTTAANEAVTGLVALGKKTAGIDLGPLGDVGDVFKSIGQRAIDAQPAIRAFEEINTAVKRARDLFKDDAGFAPPKVSQAGTDAFGLQAFTRENLDDPQLAIAMAEAGKKAGSAFTKGVGDGITTDHERAVNAARRTLAQVIAEGKAAVAETIKAGNLAVQAAAVEAKQNLTQIGSDLAQQASQLIDSGPLGQRIAALQARLDSSRTGDQRRSLRQGLRDAQAELKRAEAQVQTGPGQQLSAAQKAGLEQFLRPFREKVKDAQAALAEFTTEGVISKLQRQADRQKKVVTQGIADLVAKFNAGQITITELNARTAGVLQKNVGPFATAGKAQGFAFRQAFAAELRALRAQASAIVLGPGTTQTGAEPKIVSPADAARKAAEDVKAAQKAATDRQVTATGSVTAAVKALHKSEQAAATPSGVLGQILNELKAMNGKAPKTPTAKPSSTVAPRQRPRP